MVLFAVLLDAVDFDAEVLAVVDFRAGAFVALVLFDVEDDGLDFFAADFVVVDLEELVLAALDFDGVDFLAVDFDAVDFDAVVFDGLDFFAVDFDAVDFDAVDFDAVDFAAVLLDGVLLDAVLLDAADCLVGVDLLVAAAVAFLATSLALGSLGSFLAPETTALSSAPAVNLGIAVFLALMRSPVRGLRTQRASRTRFSNDPKPVIATFSPRATSRVIVSSTDSKAFCACLRLPSKRVDRVSIS
ncbi:MAG: hypothetical protein QOK15_1934 [Nocardioidaceae bacterium]|nr:hypothetical protein [Nocardioidaceae bacterium]